MMEMEGNSSKNNLNPLESAILEFLAEQAHRRAFPTIARTQQ